MPLPEIKVNIVGYNYSKNPSLEGLIAVFFF